VAVSTSAPALRAVKLGAVNPPAICYIREPRLNQSESSVLSTLSNPVNERRGR
jgi:hypothetical protein